VCKWFEIYILCKCKNECIYIILHGLIKQCKCKYIYLYDFIWQWENNINIKQCKKCDFDLRRGDFIMVLKISQLNGSLQKTKKKKNPSKYTPRINSFDFARE
jgi:hypothetical protein